MRSYTVDRVRDFILTLENDGFTWEIDLSGDGVPGDHRSLGSARDSVGSHRGARTNARPG